MSILSTTQKNSILENAKKDTRFKFFTKEQQNFFIQILEHEFIMKQTTNNQERGDLYSQTENLWKQIREIDYKKVRSN